MRDALQSGVEIVDVAPHGILAAILDRSNARQRHDGRDRSAQHRLAEILFVVLRKRGDFSGEAFADLAGPGLKTRQALADVGEETALALFAIRRNVNTAFNLHSNALRNRVSYASQVAILIHG